MTPKPLLRRSAPAKEADKEDAEGKASAKPDRCQLGFCVSWRASNHNSFAKNRKSGASPAGMVAAMSSRSLELFGGPQFRPTQQALIGALLSDLEFALTLLQTSQNKTASAHSKAALIKAWAVLDSVRHFMGRIQDPAKWQEIQTRANTLEVALAEVQDAH